MAKFTSVDELSHRPGPEGCRRRGHITAERYYRTLTYITPQRALSVHRKPHTTGGRQKKSRAALEGGYRQARLNNEIVTRCNALINLVYAVYGRFLRRGHVL
jgi:hypothetical protein